MVILLRYRSKSHMTTPPWLLGHVAALNGGARLKTGKELEPFSQIVQGPKEAFADCSQRLTAAADRRASESTD